MAVIPTHSFTGSVLLSAGLLACGTAFAVEQIYHGSSCQNIYPPQGTLGQNVYSGPEGLYFGDAATAVGSWRYIVCPLDRRNVTNTNGIRNVEIALTNRSGGMWCSVSSQDRFGGYVRRVTRTPMLGRRLVSWGSTVNASTAYGSYSVFCVLGSGDTIHTIRLSEY